MPSTPDGGAYRGFDPDAPLTEDTLFGLPDEPERSLVRVIPVPFGATVSYGTGCADGPAAIKAASLQVDFLDRRFGNIYNRGIWMEPIPQDLRRLSDRARAAAEPIIERGGATPEDADALAEIDAAGNSVRAHVSARVTEALAKGKFPLVLGGEHAVSQGAIEACAKVHGPVGVIQIDAHMDLREAYEGMAFSHASVMHNCITRAGVVSRLVQVGIRDYCAGEQDLAEQSGVVRTYFDDDLADQLAAGTPWLDLCRQIVADLPEPVYVTLDIDGLDPACCPSTGTPVPGGLSFRELSVLLQVLADSGKRIVGADLVEVAPGPTEWDANVGARVLYRLCALARP